MKQFLVIILVLSAIAGGFFALFNYNSDGGISSIFQEDTQGVISSGTTQSPEELRAKEIEQSIVITNSAIISANPSQCERITLSDIKSECLEKSNLSLALKENDPELCDALSSSGQIECKNQIYFAIAQSSGDLEDCKKISNTGVLDKCIQDLELSILSEQRYETEAQPDKKIDCNQFSNASAIEQCKADQRLAIDRSQIEKAMNSNNTEICESIISSDLRNDCYNGVYFSEAKFTKDISLCENISDAEMKDQCKSTISDFSDSAAFQRAMEKQSIDECKSINAESMRISCMDRIYLSEIVTSGKKEDCLKIVNRDLRESCDNSF